MNELIKQIRDGITSGMPQDFFLPKFKALSNGAQFVCIQLENDTFFRVRSFSGNLFSSIADLGYPPHHSATKGRLNAAGKPVAYMSLSEMVPFAEANIGYYDMYCLARIQQVSPGTLFHCVGVEGRYKPTDATSLAVNEFCLELLTKKGCENYDATIALGEHLMGCGTRDSDGNILPIEMGVLYNSAQNEISNKPIYNVCIPASTFDKHFRVVSAAYHILALDNITDSAVIHTVNEGKTMSDGSIQWERSLEEMFVFRDRMFAGHVYIKGNVLLHYQHGAGEILAEDPVQFLVSFKGKQINIPKQLVAAVIT